MGIALLSKTRIGRAITENQRNRILLSAGISLSLNFLYAVYQGILGVMQVSLWFFSMCAFYMILAVMRFCVVVCGRKGVRRDAAISECFVMRLSGILLLLLNVVLACILFISLSQNTAIAYDKITMITIAAYTFYKITGTAIRAFRQHGDSTPLFVVIRNISYVEVAVSVLTLQRSMLVTFGSVEKEQMDKMNALTGGAVCLFVLLLGILLILKARKENALWQNQNL